MDRKNKLTKYQVSVTRTIEHVATVEVDAPDLDAAKALGIAKVCEGDTHWVEGNMVDETAKARVLP